MYNPEFMDEYHQESTDYESEDFGEFLDDEFFDGEMTHGNYPTPFSEMENHQFMEFREAMTEQFPEMSEEDIEAISEFAFGPIIAAVSSALPTIIKGVSGLIKGRKRPRPVSRPQARPRPRPRPRPAASRGNPLNMLANVLRNPSVLDALLQLASSGRENIGEDDYDYDDNYEDDMALA